MGLFLWFVCCTFPDFSSWLGIYCIGYNHIMFMQAGLVIILRVGSIIITLLPHPGLLLKRFPKIGPVTIILIHPQLLVAGYLHVGDGAILQAD